MLSNTLIFIFYFYFLFFSILGYGFFILYYLNVNLRKLSIGLSGLAGFFCLSFISFVTHIFFSHNFSHNIIIHILGILFFLFFFSKNFYLFEIKKLLIFIIFFISALFISKNHEDFPYYHLPYMIHIVENKLQFGLGLLNISFKTSSSLFYLQSTFYLPYVDFYLFHSANLIIFTFACIFFFDTFVDKKKSFFIRILASLSFVFLNVAFARLGAFGTDRGGQVISFVLIVLLLDLFNKKNIALENLKVLIILVFYIVTLKSYFLPYLLILLLLFVTKYKYLLKILYNFKIIFLLTIFFLIFLFINFSISGCFLYPIKYSCIENFSWSESSIRTAEHFSKWYELWAKAGATPNYRVDNPEIYIQFFNWVPNWINNYFLGKGLDITFVVLGISIIYVLFLRKKEVNNLGNKFYLVYLFLIVLFIIWFNKHPDFRYGGYVIYALLFFIPLSNYLSKFCKKNNKNFFLITMILAIFFFNSKNLIRIIGEISSKSETYFFKNFPFFNIKNPNYTVILLNDNSKAYFVNNEMCWATPSPCLSATLKRKTVNNYQIYYNE